MLGIVTCGLTASIAAAQNTSTPVRSPEGAGSNMRTVTVTGCLERGAQANTFMLTKVADPLTDSVAASAGSAVPTVTYQLSGGQNLASHLGHRVEVTGKTTQKPKTPVKVADAESKREVTAGKKTATTEVKEKAAISVRSLAVDSLRMISADCSGTPAK